MTLATSGSISIGGTTANRSINLELGRSATATSSLGESALRALANDTSGAISMSTFRGKSNLLDTQTVTVGYAAPALYTVETRGYDDFLNVGSISDGTLNPVGNKPITILAWLGSNSTGTTVLNGVYLQITGSVSNSGFTTMKVGSTSFNRTSAIFTQGTSSFWRWPTTTNPFGSTGAVVSVEFA